MKFQKTLRFIFALQTACCLLPTFSFAQHLNKAGHLVPVVADTITTNVRNSSKGQEVQVDGITLMGNSVLRIPQGYVTLSGNDENSPSTVRVYSKTGQESFSKSFPQTINFVLSPAKKFCAFFDMSQICVIDLTSKSLVQYPSGSTVFTVNDDGQVAYYDEKTSALVCGSTSAPVSEPVYRVLFYNDAPLFVTMKTIMKLKNGTAKTVFTALEGRIFDVKVFSSKIYLSIKKEMPTEFIFNSYSTTDLVELKGEEEVHYSLIQEKQKKNERINPNVEVTTAIDSIRDPLYYFTDTVYQPVGNSYDEMQEYSPGAMYPHPGVDLLGYFTQNFYAVKKGYVKAILTTSGQYHWRIANANQNTSGPCSGYLYAHVEETSIPYAVGDSMNEAAILGYLVDFPVTGFVHLHFARIKDQGVTWNSWWTYDNPLSYMTNFFDTIPPQFELTINNDEFAFRDVNGNYLSKDSLYGNVKVISKVHDRINATWHCDVNKLRYSVSPLLSPQTMLLDSFAYEYDFYNDFYFGGTYYLTLLRTIYSRDVTCFTTADYGVRDFYHIVTNSDGNDSISNVDSLQFFNTLSLPNASYIFRVTASDPSGNTTSDSMIVKIRNGGSGIHDLSSSLGVSIYPNPSAGKMNVMVKEKAELSIFNALGEKIKEQKLEEGVNTIDISNQANGIYFGEVRNEKGVWRGKVIKD